MMSCTKATAACLYMAITVGLVPAVAAPVFDAAPALVAGDAPAGTSARAADDGGEAAPASRNQQWDIRIEDRTVYGALRRWAAQSRPRRQVSWEIPVDFPVTVTDSFSGSFEAAVSRVMSALEMADYPPKGCFHSNGVLRVVRRVGDGLECER